jgi:hypothetical protein
MIKKFIFAVLVLLLCSACVSRTITEPVGLNSGEKGNTVKKTKIIWIWDKEYKNP